MSRGHAGDKRHAASHQGDVTRGMCARARVPPAPAAIIQSWRPPCGGRKKIDKRKKRKRMRQHMRGYTHQTHMRAGVGAAAIKGLECGRVGG